MALTMDRMNKITVDMSLDRGRDGYTDEENEFRDEVEEEWAEFSAANPGATIDIPSEVPD